MDGQVAVKRLSAVEVDPESSNQHEFNAGALRTGLGFGREKVSGQLTAVYYGSDPEVEPEVEDGTFTLYDAREAHPTRSEFRLYYNVPLVTEAAEAGDLLVLFRTPEAAGLRAVIARAGSPAEAQLLDALFEGDRPSLDTFQLVAPPAPTESAAEELTAALSPVPVEATLARYAATGHPLFASALAADEVPDTLEMAQAGAALASAVHGTSLSPDERLFFSLAAETELFFAISDAIDQRWLDAEIKKGAVSFRQLAAYVTSRAQSRKSRRGSSLQHHFGWVLDGAGIRYTPQCVTEGKETPDFIVPGYDEYHDAKWPDDRLRMVACKSTAKERWRQALEEADRIEEKYFLTLDTKLTDDVIRAMNAKLLRPFLPLPVLDATYAKRVTRGDLRSVAELLDELGAVL
ncbi:MAG TPA: type II restriction endonuclease [Candidatus Limnocylindrales bacterium]|nr:type II restriction endonuclease [Candidatus Limnocylindrales bacterium]